jgi:hypothetical protein
VPGNIEKPVHDKGKWKSIPQYFDRVLESKGTTEGTKLADQSVKIVEILEDVSSSSPIVTG